MTSLPVDVALAVHAHRVVAVEAGEAVGAVVDLAAARVGASGQVADEALTTVNQTFRVSFALGFANG